MKIDTQSVVDRVMDHIGGERWQINTAGDFHRKDGRGNDCTFNYSTLMDATRDAYVRLLERRVGRHFSWSSWAYDNESDADLRDEGWLVAQPIGLSSSAMQKNKIQKMKKSS